MPDRASARDRAADAVPRLQEIARTQPGRGGYNAGDQGILNKWIHADGIDVELLQTGAILHDFGKIDELSYDRAFSYTNDGQMLGHLVMETVMVAEQINRVAEFPEELRRQLLHLLLAHHGKLEHGSPKLPMTPEALMLAYLSNLSASLTHYGTTSGPIYFGAGYVSQQTWWKLGLITSVPNILIWTAVGIVWWKMIGYW